MGSGLVILARLPSLSIGGSLAVAPVTSVSIERIDGQEQQQKQERHVAEENGGGVKSDHADDAQGMGDDNGDVCRSESHEEMGVATHVV